VEVPLPSIKLDTNAELYFQILHAIETVKGADYAALYLIGSCTRCPKYRKPEMSEN
jgi:hypothetical protein